MYLLFFAQDSVISRVLRVFSLAAFFGGKGLNASQENRAPEKNPAATGDARPSPAQPGPPATDFRWRDARRRRSPPSLYLVPQEIARMWEAPNGLKNP